MLGDILIFAIMLYGGIYFVRASFGDHIESNVTIREVIEKKIETGFFKNRDEGFKYYKKIWRLGGILFIVFSILFY